MCKPFHKPDDCLVQPSNAVSRASRLASSPRPLRAAPVAPSHHAAPPTRTEYDVQGEGFRWMVHGAEGGGNSWLKAPSEDSAPSASLEHSKAQAAPTHPGAPPGQLGGLPGTQSRSTPEAAPRIRILHFRPPGTWHAVVGNRAAHLGRPRSRRWHRGRCILARQWQGSLHACRVIGARREWCVSACPCCVCVFSESARLVFPDVCPLFCAYGLVHGGLVV